MTTTATPTKAEKALLDSLVPDPEIVDRYISRQVEGFLDLDVLHYARGRRFNVLLQGPTGPGKTMFCRAFAAQERMPFFAVPCNGAAEPTQLFGRTVRDHDGSWIYRYGAVSLIQRYGGLVLWDEVNFLPPKIAAYIHPMLDARRQLILVENDDEVIDAHEDTLHVAALNPGYRGTYRTNQAFLNRFAVTIDWPYDDEVEAQLVASPTLRSLAKKLRDMPEAVATPVSTNMLDEFERFVEDLGLSFAVTNFVAHFEEHERGAVANVFELERNRLADEYRRGLGRDPEKGTMLEDDDA